MSRPKGVREGFARINNAWRARAPNKTFGGMTLMQFEEECLPSQEARNLIGELQDGMTKAPAVLDAADEKTAAKIQLVVAGDLGDPTEGPDSALYEAFGDAPSAWEILVPPDEYVWFVAEDNGGKGSDNLWLYEGKIRPIVIVLSELFHFEYYIVSKKLEWLLCENHHNIPDRCRAAGYRADGGF